MGELAEKGDHAIRLSVSMRCGGCHLRRTDPRKVFALARTKNGDAAG